MSSTQLPAADEQKEGARDPQDRLRDIRALVAAGERVRGSFATAVYSAATAADPAATEDTLAVLPGNGGMHLYRSLIAWAAPVPGERVLDLGCGSGGATRVAAEIVGVEGEVVGVDPSPEALDLARERTPEDMPVQYVQARGENLAALPDRYFDAAIASLVIDQVADLPRVLSELYRVLRPGGRIGASVWAFDNMQPLNQAVWGALLAVVAQYAPGALAGRASRASIPRERDDIAAFRDAELLTPEEREGQLALVMEDIDEAMAFFDRTAMVMMLPDEGRKAFREALERRLPHALYFPVRFLRSRRPG
ncbi:MAG: methyltransferase domain-containing protein [Thermoleophilia bacterium]|nr:methyltransferase domain-containing protein [Thermoleophilia bacterium]MDH3724960.1 methyltransferase domain-containing protein [Thermoleophilia bacterium]